MKTSGLLFIFLACSFFVWAQPDSIPSKKPSYFNSFHAGGLFGKKGNGSGESFSMIHGIRFQKFGYGLGVGYDAYQEWRTVPFFASVNLDFRAVGENTFFVRIDAGYAAAWYPNEDEEPFVYDQQRGPMVHPLLGYRIRSEKFHLYITAGYKFQAINYVRTPRWTWDSGWGGGLSKMYVGRDIERISLQLGFGFQ
jgi:hypothetical protein